MVTAQQNGVIARSTVPNRTTGEFFLARLEPGNYDVVLTANGRATTVVAAVPVASPTVTVPLSTSGAPLTLSFSAQANTTPGTGKYAVEASAIGVAPKSVPAVDLTTGDKSGVDFTLQ